MSTEVDDTKFKLVVRSDGIWLIINLQKFGIIHFEPDDNNPYTFTNFQDAHTACLKIQNGEV
jgi:hypothetical protein